LLGAAAEARRDIARDTVDELERLLRLRLRQRAAHDDLADARDHRLVIARRRRGHRRHAHDERDQPHASSMTRCYARAMTPEAKAAIRLTAYARGGG